MKFKKIVILFSSMLVLATGCNSKTDAQKNDTQNTELSNEKVYKINEDKSIEESTKEEAGISNESKTGNKKDSAMVKVDSETNKVMYSDDGGKTWHE